MRIAFNEAETREGFKSSKNEAAASFGDDRIFIEKFVTQPRHIEIQVLGDTYGNCLYLNERECSIQRRNQKVIEEAPSPFLDALTRKAMGEQAVTLAKAVNYSSAGTVEFIVDGSRNFYFLEMNTRLQVEHPVTELTTGIDIVEQMFRIAAGEKLALSQADVKLDGWAIESRVYAEDPYRGFLPWTGRLTKYRPPEESETVRNDTGVEEGGEISMFYDPMIAKLCTHAADRAGAIDAMETALDRFELEGIGHNLPFLSAVMAHPKFRSGEITTAFIAEEFPDGFSGVALQDATLENLAAIAAACNMEIQTRATQISGTMENHRRVIGSDWVIVLNGRDFPLSLQGKNGSYAVVMHDRIKQVGLNGWTPGKSLIEAEIDGAPMVVKAERLMPGLRYRYRGADVKVQCRIPRMAQLAKFMLPKKKADTGKTLRCPMPGLITLIAVVPGDEVQQGQTLATVEAMKMENVLKAERKGVVKAVLAKAGESLAVDDVILEFV
jgi:propionyl-CoA carboxylase alpha chain